MAMAVDARQQQHHPQFSSMGYDAMRYQSAAPQFTNPWVSAAPTSQGQMYATSMPAPATVGGDARYAQAPPPNASTAYAGGHPAPAMPSGMLLPMDPELMDQSGLQLVVEDMSAPRPYGAPYSSASNSVGAAVASAATAAPPTAAPAATYAPAPAPQYAAAYGYDRRSSHPLHTASEAERQSFSDALDASRGMVAMSQSDITPRAIYGTSGSARSSTDSYGFPSAHSSHSSISSASTYPTYYNSSVSEASVGDYSSASESVDMPSRTLPRPSGLPGGALPPAPQSMMSQFSSKVSTSSQKKHKCKICDKRFTRPSSLQTHMYSHTGEKPFACDVEGCGRHFSVVSNLRRHRKVHKGEGRDAPPSDDDEKHHYSD